MRSEVWAEPLGWATANNPSSIDESSVVFRDLHSVKKRSHRPQPPRLPDVPSACDLDDSSSLRGEGMFAKLKKKIAEEAAITPRPGGAARIPRTVSKESITSAGADSGDDFASDGSSSRDDPSSQISRRNDQIRKLEAKLSATLRKLQDQNETHQANRAKMAEGLALALGKKDQEWIEKLADLEKEKKRLTAQLREMREQSLSWFQKRDDVDELGEFQQQELAKVKHLLLKKEELLSTTERELAEQRKDTEEAQADLHSTSRLSAKLSEERQWLQAENSQLAQNRAELAAAQEAAEVKITELEHRERGMQDFIQQLSLDMQKAQTTASGCEKRLTCVQADYDDLQLRHEQVKAKMAVEAEEKDALVKRLQEKVSSLERTLEGRLSGEEGLQELLKEKDALELRLDETRQQLLEARTLHTGAVGGLETEVAKLNSKVEETQDILRQKADELDRIRAESSSRLEDLERTLHITSETLQRKEEELEEREEQLSSLQSELGSVSGRLTQQLSSVRQQCAERVERLETQVSALEAARELDRTAAQHKATQLEGENEGLKERHRELETALRKHEAEQEKVKEELSSRETVSVDIAKALEETRKQKEDLHQQVADLASLIDENARTLSQKNEELGRKDQEAATLKEGYDAVVLRMQQLQSDLESCRARAMLGEESAEKRVGAVKLQLEEQKETLRASATQVRSLQEEVSALHERLCPTETATHEPNGAVAADDIAQLQKENKEMAQHVAEKNKTIKQLQQRMAELKKTLQKELKIKPDVEVNEVREKPYPEPGGPSLIVTNNSDLNDSREINLEYLKHVVLKFMSAREAEAFHLLKAVSVLLHFSVEEENLLKETLEYKMSWFGSKPAPKGTVRPSISKPRTPWS
ncbi:golgin subfamily A member 1 isoform X2 [Ascaphus truei]|uniref:golgin subfamily A member 1 isoform X2 n=1 Tax=Ascaphus truei TaxID=8439 RepID=UPI003F591FFF